LARHLAARLGGAATSTDSLARHPGRPWPRADWSVPAHVVEHYGTLSVDDLLASVLAHYRSMAPMIEDLIRGRAEAAGGPLVLEGSALWPETIAALRIAAASAVWLTAEPALIQARMYAESRYAEADSAGRALIDKFLQRTLAYDDAMMAAVRRLRLPHIAVGAGQSIAAVGDVALQRMAPLA